jgi:hypothetical protein
LAKRNAHTISNEVGDAKPYGSQMEREDLGDDKVVCRIEEDGIASRVYENECDSDFSFGFAISNSSGHGHGDDIANYQDEGSNPYTELVKWIRGSTELTHG